MTKLSALVSLLVFGLTSAACAGVVEAPVKRLFVPVGFDDNDAVEVVVRGAFPSTCYSRQGVKVIQQGNDIDVTVTALLRETGSCTPTSISFNETVTLGPLVPGRYKIRVNGKLQEELSVTSHTVNTVDEHVYAKVDYVELGFTGGLSGSAFLVGHNQSDCWVLDRVETISNGKDVLSVLPIMKRSTGACDQRRSRLDAAVKFDVSAFDSEEILLFVRTMDGKSVSSVIEKD
jgi:hypothetical protein